jgi:hypothetical protein
LEHSVSRGRLKELELGLSVVVVVRIVGVEGGHVVKVAVAI